MTKTTDLITSGGLCAQVPLTYELPSYELTRLVARRDGRIESETISTRLRDYLPAFTTARGPIRFFGPDDILASQRFRSPTWKSWRYWLTGHIK